MKFTSCQSTSVKVKSLGRGYLKSPPVKRSVAITVASTRESGCARCEHRGNRCVLWTINFAMLICDHLSSCLNGFFCCIFAIIEFGFDFMLFSESNSMMERKRAWIALHLHLNHGHDRKPEGEPSFIMNDLLS